MAELTLITWRDIPAQVIATDGTSTCRRELPDRFQKAIDAAAMKAGLIESGAYLEEWRRETRPCGPDVDTEAAREVERIEAAFDREALVALVRAGGVDLT